MIGHGVLLQKHVNSLMSWIMVCKHSQTKERAKHQTAELRLRGEGGRLRGEGGRLGGQKLSQEQKVAALTSKQSTCPSNVTRPWARYWTVKCLKKSHWELCRAAHREEPGGGGASSRGGGGCGRTQLMIYCNTPPGPGADYTHKTWYKI